MKESKKVIDVHPFIGVLFFFLAIYGLADIIVDVLVWFLGV